MECFVDVVIEKEIVEVVVVETVMGLIGCGNFAPGKCYAVVVAVVVVDEAVTAEAVAKVEAVVAVVTVAFGAAADLVVVAVIVVVAVVHGDQQFDYFVLLVVEEGWVKKNVGSEC